MKKFAWLFLLLGLILASLACGSLTADEEPTPTPRPTGESQGEISPSGDSDLPPAVIENDEGGPVVLQGEVTYTNFFFTTGVAQPVIILEDQAGFVDRDRGFLMPSASQTIGQITSDFFTSPFTYSLTLPIEPQGTPRDVDNDGQSDPGIMVFAVAYWNNIWGDPFLEERDLGGGGWSGAYASTRISEELETQYEVVGGKVVVYASDANQGFPSGFGEDGLLFTEDDPIVGLPQGWTVVDMDVEPFIFDRSREQVLDLIEPEGSALDDFSDMPYDEAFDAMIDKMSREYAFTDYKGLNWNALYDEFAPRFEEAERRNDQLMYLRALRDFIWRIPDGHVSGGFVVDDFWAEVGGSLGFNMREMSDGRAIVTYVHPGGSADREGIQLGAEILSVDGLTPSEAIDRATAWFGPHSTPHNERLDKTLFAVRFPFGEEIEVSYRNPGSASSTTASLLTIQEVDTLFAGMGSGELSGFELPVEYTLLPDGYAYVKIYSFMDNDLLTIQLWERLMQTLNENNVPGLIIDLRFNGGGRGFMADQMAAHFFDEELVLGNTGYYDESLDDFYFDTDVLEHFILPPEDLHYDGDLAVLISPDCASACEFFAYDLTLEDRATIIGHYPTAGLGGSVEVFTMPEDEDIRFTIGRAVDSDGNIHIEGMGVPPDIVVPITEEALLGDEDVLLEAAISYLNSR